MTRNKCDPTFKKISNFWRIAKIPPIFKEAEVLPRRLPNFGNGNNFVFLSIKLPLTHIPLGLKFRREIDHSNFTSTMAGQNNFFPDPSTPYHNDNSYPAYVYGSYPENSGRFHWHYLREEQQSQASRSSSPSSSIMLVEELSSAGSSPELSKSNKKKKGKKYDTWSQADIFVVDVDSSAICIF